MLLDGHVLRFEIEGTAIWFRFTGESARTEQELRRVRSAERARDRREAERASNTEKRADELKDQVQRLEGELAKIASRKGSPTPKKST